MQGFFNDYCKLVLLYVWNPLIGSLRGLQKAAELENVAKALNVKRFALCSFCEAPRMFDPEQLKPIVQELARQVAPVCDDPRLKELKHAITPDRTGTKLKAKDELWKKLGY